MTGPLGHRTFKPTNLVGVAPEPDTWQRPPGTTGGGTSALSALMAPMATGPGISTCSTTPLGMSAASVVDGTEISTTTGCGTPHPRLLDSRDNTVPTQPQPQLRQPQHLLRQHTTQIRQPTPTPSTPTHSVTTNLLRQNDTNSVNPNTYSGNTNNYSVNTDTYSVNTDTDTYSVNTDTDTYSVQHRHHAYSTTNDSYCDPNSSPAAQAVTSRHGCECQTVECCIGGA